MSEFLRTSQTSEELLDEVDQYGEPTGRVLSKKTIHDQGIRHRDVHVWVTNGTDFVEQQRNFDKSIMPGEWDISVGGHVGAGESYLDAAVRETSEELGLDFARKRFINIGKVASMEKFPGWKSVHNIVGDNFVVLERDLKLKDIRVQKEEVRAARFYPIDQLEADLANPKTAKLHAPQPPALYKLGIEGMRRVAAQR